MSNGNRLTKEELRTEVKEYLISLREERIRRSKEVKERLKQLRHERIERLYDVRTSLNVMESMRLKTQLVDNREGLRDRVQQLRAETRVMLKEYSETRKVGFAASEKLAENNESPISSEVVAQSITDTTLDISQQGIRVNAEPEQAIEPSSVVQGVPSPSKPESKPMEGQAKPTKQDDKSYRNMLSRVVTGLGAREHTSAKADSGEKKESSLMGRIRRLASGENQTLDNASKVTTPKVDVKTPQSAVKEEKKEVLWKTMGSTEGLRSSTSPPLEVPTPVVIAVKTKGHQVNARSEAAGKELLEIAGIGPSVLKRLERIGICTIQDLASTSVGRLEESFGEYAKLTDLGDWIAQAKLKMRNKR